MNKADPASPGRRAALHARVAGSAVMASADRYPAWPRGARAGGGNAPFEAVHGDAEWLALPGLQRFAVLRQRAAEAPFSSPLDDELRAGAFACAGCAFPL